MHMFLCDDLYGAFYNVCLIFHNHKLHFVEFDISVTHYLIKCRNCITVKTSVKWSDESKCVAENSKAGIA